MPLNWIEYDYVEAKYSSRMTETVRLTISKHSLSDTFQFVHTVKNLNLDGTQFVSFHTISLHTNIPTDETTNYKCDYVQQNNNHVGLHEVN